MNAGSDTKFVIKVTSYELALPSSALASGERVQLSCNFDKREQWSTKKIAVEKKRLKGAMKMSQPFVNLLWSPSADAPDAASLVGFTQQTAQSFDYSTRYVDRLDQRFLVVALKKGGVLQTSEIGEARISVLDVVRAGGGRTGRGDHVVSCQIQRNATTRASELAALDITLRIRLSVICHTRVEISLRNLSIGGPSLKYSHIAVQFVCTKQTTSGAAASGAEIVRAKWTTPVAGKPKPSGRAFAQSFVATLGELLDGKVKLSFVRKALLKETVVGSATVALASFLPLLERACTNGPVSSTWDGESRWFTSPISKGRLVEGCITVRNAAPDLLEELPQVAVANPTFAVQPLEAAGASLLAPHLLTLQDGAMVWSTAAESTRCRILKQWNYEEVAIAMKKTQDGKHKWDVFTIISGEGSGGHAPAERFTFRIESARLPSLVQEAAGRKLKARLARTALAKVAHYADLNLNKFAAVMLTADDGTAGTAGAAAAAAGGGGGGGGGGGDARLRSGNGVLFCVSSHHMYLVDVASSDSIAGWKFEQLAGWRVNAHDRSIALSVYVDAEVLDDAELADDRFATPVVFKIATKEDPFVVSGVLDARIKALFEELRLRRMVAEERVVNFAAQILVDATGAIPVRTTCVLTLDEQELRFEDLRTRRTLAVWPYEHLLECEGDTRAGTATLLFDRYRIARDVVGDQFKLVCKILDRDADEMNGIISQRFAQMVQTSERERVAYEQNVASLVEMGFARCTVISALRSVGGDVSAALDIVTSGGDGGADQYEVVVPPGRGPLGLQLGQGGERGAAVALPLLSSGRIARAGAGNVSVGDELIAVNGRRVPDVGAAKAILGRAEGVLLRLLFVSPMRVVGAARPEIRATEPSSYTVHVTSRDLLGLALAEATAADGRTVTLRVQQLLRGAVVVSPGGAMCAPGHLLVGINGVAPTDLTSAVRALAVRPLTLVFRSGSRRGGL